MKVFKFGGASIESVQRAKAIPVLLRDFSDEKLILVISAKGKTTNALEKIATCYFKGESAEAMQLFHELQLDHFNYSHELLGKLDVDLEQKITELCTEVEWVLQETIYKPFDYYYDQIVGVGELLSTAIMHAYLKSELFSASWIDVRDILKTDTTFRDASIDWTKTESLAKKRIGKEFERSNLIVTQGYIGSTSENDTATLGREGSDYSAAVFANILDAESVTIWKDVPSLLNADPKLFPNTVPIEEITFHEVIEMAFYGAQVIHPKTIKPLQNKNIPLYVKCFLDKNLKGTLIHNTEKVIAYPPIMVLKTNQILLQVNTKDYSFITEDNLSKIYNLFHECKIKINLIQNAAISFVACIDSNLEKLDKLLGLLQLEYDVKRNENLFLFTVRHYTQHILDEELKNRTILLEQKTRQTIQMVVK